MKTGSQTDTGKEIVDAAGMPPAGAAGQTEESPDANLCVGGDEIITKLKRQVESGVMKQENADLIYWFYAFCRENHYGPERASKELGYDAYTTLYRVFKGTYGASVENVCQRMARFKKMTEERSRVSQLHFVETSVAKTVFEVCNASVVMQSISMIFGASQIGKTWALQEFARRNNHGATKYVRLPAAAGIAMVAKEIARACYVSPDSCWEKLRDRILRSILSSHLLIIDEAHEAFLCYQKGSAIKVFEFLREIYDRTGCGMVICGTNVLKDEIQTGKLELMLKQLDRRGIIKVQLPDVTSLKDCDKVAKEWLGLPPSEGEAREIIKDLVSRFGLNAYVHYLKSAASLAANKDEKVTWGHFLRAYDAIQTLSVRRGQQ